ncbi:MAG: undecaprenyl-diphosphate phosphatase [Desulfovibrionaceae bacterium]|nr:undecaprenyl-diphosphate phosphatase [Desulfovibrionaceae bacterium]MBO4794387.1 undecaprenyl-diphosphate phosphatase [Deltaproteobacteria bacterium]MBR5734500.1 undecaprenyl-diphosphate phosphatase [Desulfovibrionaceae bacterium]
MNWFILALILGAVEGLTEFLPVSSTGHLIIAGEILGFHGELASVFEVAIQLGAILAVAVLYWRRFSGLARGLWSWKVRPEEGLSGLRGLWLLFLTTLPPSVFGLLLHSRIKKLFSPETVALALVAGALCMLLAEWLAPRRKERIPSLDAITPGLALGIGFFQCLALWPGFSRSAATIMGGMLLGARRSVAAEYSFIAAVPLMLAATGYDVLKNLHSFSAQDIPFFAAGFAFSFLFAWLAVKTFIALMGRLTLRPFAWYRLLIAPIVWYFLAR